MKNFSFTHSKTPSATCDLKPSTNLVYYYYYYFFLNLIVFFSFSMIDYLKYYVRLFIFKNYLSFPHSCSLFKTFYWDQTTYIILTQLDQNMLLLIQNAMSPG